MKKYKILTKGFMQKMEKFEEELNAQFRNGWKTKTITADHTGRLLALLEKMDQSNSY